MTYPTLYRKRIIPDECIQLKDDRTLHCDEDIILTKWNAIRPKKDLHHGYSCYFLKKGFKVSKFYCKDGSLLYWYCDIVEYEYRREDNSLTTLDLLADVIVYPDGFVKVMDLDELALSIKSPAGEHMDHAAGASIDGALSMDLLQKCLIRLNNLLQIIYSGNFHTLQKYINEIEQL